MKIKPIAYLAVKVLAVYFFARALETGLWIVSFAVTKLADSGLFIVGETVITFISLLLVSLLLWFLAAPLSSRMAPPGDEYLGEVNAPRFNLGQLQAAAFSLVGLILVATGLPAIVNSVGELIMYNREAAGYPEAHFLATQHLRILAQSIKLILGLSLFLGGKALANLGTKIRQAGPPAPPGSNTNETGPGVDRES